MPSRRKTKTIELAVAAALVVIAAVLSVLSTAQAHANGSLVAASTSAGSPGEGPVMKLFTEVARVMSFLGGDLQLSDSQLASLVGAAYEELDPSTGYPYRSARGNPVPYYVFEPTRECAETEAPVRTVLFLGGVHPDEVSPVYTSFRAALELLLNPRRRPPNTRVIYVPLVNPDGMLHTNNRGKPIPTRANHNGTDLNRDFLSAHPEIETRFVSQLIAVFRPTHIVSLHGPFGWVDYDGPGEGRGATSAMRAYAADWVARTSAAGRKHLPLNNAFGTYKGSLGSYGGNTLQRHIMTIEYPHEDGRQSESDWHDYGDSVIEALDVGTVPAGEVALPGFAR